MKNLKTLKGNELALAFGIAVFMGWAVAGAGPVVGVGTFAFFLVFTVLCLLAG